MINSVTFTGNLAADPEEIKGDRQTRGKARLAVSQGKEKPTIWLDLTAWGQWEIKDLMRCRKGSRITVSGRLELREWSDRDGNSRQTLGISLTGIEQHEREERRAPAPNSQPIASALDDDDDLPF
jgi:single-stranded DNA-binding protein